jgi:hypothetical protein
VRLIWQKLFFQIIANNPASILIVLGFFLLFSSNSLGVGGVILGLIMMGIGIVFHTIWLSKK